MDYKKRFYIIAALLGLYVCFIWFKSFQTVIIDGPKYRAKVEKLKVDSIPIPQLRGFIFADDNELLAGSLPEYDVSQNDLDLDAYTTVSGKAVRNRIRHEVVEKLSKELSWSLTACLP